MALTKLLAWMHFGMEMDASDFGLGGHSEVKYAGNNTLRAEAYSTQRLHAEFIVYSCNCVFYDTTSIAEVKFY